jgi:hypothetical protein
MPRVRADGLFLTVILRESGRYESVVSIDVCRALSANEPAVATILREMYQDPAIFIQSDIRYAMVSISLS